VAVGLGSNIQGPNGIRTFEGNNNLPSKYQEGKVRTKFQDWVSGIYSWQTCTECDGYRLKKKLPYQTWQYHNRSSGDDGNIRGLGEWFEDLKQTFPTNTYHRLGGIEGNPKRIGFLLDIRLDYLSLIDRLRTLSGGEGTPPHSIATQTVPAARWRLVLFLDEPSIGLHQADNVKLYQSPQVLSRFGKFVLVKSRHG